MGLDGYTTSHTGSTSDFLPITRPEGLLVAGGRAWVAGSRGALEVAALLFGGRPDYDALHIG